MPLFSSRRELARAVITVAVLPPAIALMDLLLCTEYDGITRPSGRTRLTPRDLEQCSRGAVMLVDLQRMFLSVSWKGMQAKVSGALTEDYFTAGFLAAAGFVKVTDLIGMDRVLFRAALQRAEQAGHPRQHHLYAISMPDDA